MKKKANAKKEHLLRWQKLLIPDSPNKLIMTEQQLKSATMQQVENDLRIIQDCVKLVEKTTKPDVFFMRLNLLKEKSKHLASFEKYIKFSGASPTAAYNDVVQNYHEAVNKFLIRYFSETFDKAEAMKTEKGRIGKYQKFYDSLQEYYCYMSYENIDYIETKYKAYTRH
jgi:hypothetical protein